jgi:hypothetical protein
LRELGYLFGQSHHGGAFVFIEIDYVGGAAVSMRDEQLSGGQHRVAGVVADDVALGAVGRFEVGSGMSHQPNGADVQERGAAMVPDPFGGGECGGVGGGQIASVGREVGQARSVGVGRRDPPVGGSGADTDPVVLAYK